MEIRDSTVRHLEALAALRLGDAERERLRTQLERILEYMQQLDALDVRDVPPTYHVIAAQTSLRPDEVRPPLLPEEVLRNAPSTNGPFYRVPRFVGEAEAPATADPRGADRDAEEDEPR